MDAEEKKVELVPIASDVDFRTGPSIIYPRTRIVKKGTEVEFVQKLDNGWTKIKYELGNNEYVGWVYIRPKD